MLNVQSSIECTYINDIDLSKWHKLLKYHVLYWNTVFNRSYYTAKKFLIIKGMRKMWLSLWKNNPMLS